MQDSENSLWLLQGCKGFGAFQSIWRSCMSCTSMSHFSAPVAAGFWVGPLLFTASAHWLLLGFLLVVGCKPCLGCFFSCLPRLWLVYKRLLLWFAFLCRIIFLANFCLGFFSPFVVNYLFSSGFNLVLSFNLAFILFYFLWWVVDLFSSIFFLLGLLYYCFPCLLFYIISHYFSLSFLIKKRKERAISNLISVDQTVLAVDWEGKDHPPSHV